MAKKSVRIPICCARKFAQKILIIKNLGKKLTPGLGPDPVFPHSQIQLYRTSYESMTAVWNPVMSGKINTFRVLAECGGGYIITMSLLDIIIYNSVFQQTRLGKGYIFWQTIKDG
jgi:hypothetical protein